MVALLARVIKEESSMAASNRPVFIHFETLHMFCLYQNYLRKFGEK